MRKTIFGALLLFAALTLPAVNVDPGRAVIVVDKKADGVIQFAAQELQKYLKMITGTEIAIVSTPEEGKYPFLFGTPEGATLKPEEACWEVTGEYTRLYGDSTPTGDTKIRLKKILDPKTRSGDLTAVYDFLEKQLGVLFLAPGEDGIAYEPVKILELKEGKNSWVPELAYRYLWPDRTVRTIPKYYQANGKLKAELKTKTPADLLPATRAGYEEKILETLLWLKQQRIGEHGEKLKFGHAFTRWWEKYGESHPEYFALVDGKRQPKVASQPDRVKLCVSNPAVWKQIVADWAADKNRSRLIDVCENDSKNYCECPECRKLDMPPRPGEKWDDDLSDRYIYFANQVLNEARKIDPDAAVCHYAYSVYKRPPRREKVDPAVYIGLVSADDDLEELCQGWYEAGARKIYLRPNVLHSNISIPTGFEESLFSALKTGFRCGIIGTSYDTLHGFWDISGLGDYVLARCQVDPSKDYDCWLNEYCSAYGPAAPEARAYFEYYRTEIWNKRIRPNRKAIREAGRGNFRRGLMWNIGTYYKESDFDELDKILRTGLEKNLSPQQKRRLETLLLVNEHSRLTWRAMSSEGRKKIRAAMDLLQFRRANKDRLNINWDRLIDRVEIYFGGDCTGIRTAEMLRGYEDFRETPRKWSFRVDPEKTGEAETWHELPFSDFRETAKQEIRTDFPWERQKQLTDESFRTMLETYDGIGYYAQEIAIPPEWKDKEIFLLFGAVDESAWVYVNGKFAGSHTGWNTSFAIPISEAIDWTKEKQTVIVRVEDKAGQGGIWRPVWLTAGSKE